MKGYIPRDGDFLGGGQSISILRSERSTLVLLQDTLNVPIQDSGQGRARLSHLFYKLTRTKSHLSSSHTYAFDLLAAKVGVWDNESAPGCIKTSYFSFVKYI